MDNIRLYIKESYDELINHVSWPSWNELFDSAKLVLIGTALFALLIFIFDLVFNNIKVIYSI
jgi:preprotein translocase subunit SecE